MQRLVPVILVTLAALGCGSDVEKHLSDGVDALADCDVRGAHDAFAAAYDGDPDDARAALGFALTELALLPEDPVVTSVLADFGFTAAIDMQILVFGADGALARYARGDTCESVDAFVDANVPYPPLSDPNIDELAIITAGLTIGDLVSAAQLLEPRLGRIAEALTTAAEGSADPVTIDGGCGLGTVTLQPPELFALAAVIQTARAAIKLAAAYDWDIDVVLVIRQESDDIPALVASLNQHLGRVVSAAAAAPARDHLRAAMALATSAAEAANQIGGQIEDGLFDWSQFPVTLATEIASFATSVAAASEGRAPLAGFAPALQADLSVLLAASVDLGDASAPIFSVESDQFGNYLVTDGEALAGPFAAVVSPAPWSNTAPAYQWALGDQLDVFDADPVIDPAQRYQNVFECMPAAFSL